ncbi:hypothetical protein GUITHDRAFT_117322 [Guillardia theta CCMP2712]|uniref:Uncharacterized protein n=1 Tax=Guillardia theta (strain CCMP2712) TaxID=905079 RepID=L1IJX6_GUITC|nr:hypothetical protein GUITHDRAFT_117322 [Guillardia theta CCMP2712]EKX36541.1 hypothetical protein GUITHDRAFT_117322 [Guillardia theta CCMP2712]|eukprot:XP_005823521.1 hypothetical protein GUITHDRAFT_117322 [Guillardia theta CCMP2712]
MYDIGMSLNNVSAFISTQRGTRAVVPNGAEGKVVVSTGLHAGQDMFRLVGPPGFSPKMIQHLLLRSNKQICEKVDLILNNIYKRGNGYVAMFMCIVAAAAAASAAAAAFDARYCLMSPGYVLKSLLTAIMEDCDLETVCSPKYARVCEQAMKAGTEEVEKEREQVHAAIKHILVSRRLVLFVAHDLARIVEATSEVDNPNDPILFPVDSILYDMCR